MSELIGIREAARRLGVSDTAVRKAIKAGRVHVAGQTETSGRPLVAWPDVQRDWGANSDHSKRSHVGSQGSPERMHDERPDFGPRPIETPADLRLDAEGGVVIHDGMTLNEAKTAKAIYDARLARIEYEEQQKVLVRAEEVRSKAFRLARSARDELLTMEDRLSPILASVTDLTEIRAILREEVRRVCERIAIGAEQA